MKYAKYLQFKRKTLNAYIVLLLFQIVLIYKTYFFVTKIIPACLIISSACLVITIVATIRAAINFIKAKRYTVFDDFLNNEQHDTE